MLLKRKLMDICILYGAQTWSLTNIQKSKLRVSQCADRNVLGVKLTNRVQNTTLCFKIQITGVAQKAIKLNWDWADLVCRMLDQLWANITTM